MGIEVLLDEKKWTTVGFFLTLFYLNTDLEVQLVDKNASGRNGENRRFPPSRGGGGCDRLLIEDEVSLAKSMAWPPGGSMMSRCPRRPAKIDIGSRTRDKAMGQRYFDTAFRYTCATIMLWMGCFHYCPVVFKKSVV